MQLIETEIKKRGEIGTESCRLFHGRGHCFPDYTDLLIDWFRPVVLITLYCQRDEKWLARLVTLLLSQLDGVKTILLQERFLLNSPSRILFGDLPDQVDAVEAGLKYRLRLNTAQNIGFFLDMAEGRKVVSERVKGKKVLNLFAYTCSFSVIAIASGATQVVNLDMNRGALESGRFNHQLNGLDLRKVSFLSLEMFRSFNKLRKLAPFDLIICDPPAAQGQSFQVQRDWPKLIRKLPLLLSSGGEILFCLSSPYLTPQYIEQLVTKYFQRAQLLKVYYPGDYFPEKNHAKGLNILHYRFD